MKYKYKICRVIGYEEKTLRIRNLTSECQMFRYLFELDNLVSIVSLYNVIYVIYIIL
jgi:hypothetical protein